MSAIQERAERLLTERRTMQFVIEPREWMPVKLRTLMPMVIWVYWPAGPDQRIETGSRGCCCKETFQLTPDSINQAEAVRKQIGKQPFTLVAVVCACYGQIVE